MSLVTGKPLATQEAQTDERWANRQLSLKTRDWPDKYRIALFQNWPDQLQRDGKLRTEVAGFLAQNAIPFEDLLNVLPIRIKYDLDTTSHWRGRWVKKFDDGDITKGYLRINYKDHMDGYGYPQYVYDLSKKRFIKDPFRQLRLEIEAIENVEKEREINRRVTDGLNKFLSRKKRNLKREIVPHTFEEVENEIARLYEFHSKPENYEFFSKK